jgi:hypothetical protein
VRPLPPRTDGGPPLARVGTPHLLRLNWQTAINDLKRLNDRAYTNRTFDTETVPELSNPRLMAPGETDFGSSDGVNAWDYHKFHFLSVNITKQAESLISDMERELAAIKSKIESTPMGKAVID